jgi:hypothetical protein
MEDPDVQAKQLVIRARRKLAFCISLTEEFLSMKKRAEAMPRSELSEHTAKNLHDGLFEANCAVVAETQELAAIKGRLEFQVLLLKAWAAGPEGIQRAIQMLDSVVANIESHLVDASKALLPQ